ncbi:TVP38/TMEM64 family protein [Falsiroseomonas selenitidurans]|uniref:TVP38/TMEM64 family membrane protein n=1 Tax=Falsiroseomonas selenitidurans TaxID=2716335 RepID=A0ABX1E1P6_9PROT|nr:VTT domain-containing protein [Falsiroseomonas selenitidurans]NKC29452.1 TVP38/TMEM64 family protein [Falsiroseomonas selenitidurans]
MQRLPERWRSLAKLLLLAAGLLAAGALLRQMGGVPGTGWVDRSIRDEGLWGELVFVLMGAALTAAGVPRQSVAFLGGYAFGTVLGSALGLVAQLLGCATSFFWARLLGRPWAERRMQGRFGHRLRPLRDVLRADPFAATLALRLLPVGNNLALNLLGGMAGLAAGPFLAASALGYLPQTVVFALLGKGIRVEGAWQLALGIGLFGLSILIGLLLLRRHRAGRALGGEG